MKRTTLTVMGLGLTLALAACGQPAEQKAAEAPAAPAPAMPAGDNMASMASDAAAAKSVKAKGVVTAVDVAAGTITLDHEEIPEVSWPAMTMGFKATPELAQSVKVGDKVAFDLTVKDGAGEITAIQKQ
ncbi:Cu/Ag efflux protein CusF [Phenylobacterium haematophilum]|uniref:Cu/Ag efflux protein CusF n=1 Tax=Phenylobacterium haematophilum TaxID=98513 RepID=A0A840A5N2_9CAUL|nr:MULTISPECIES: copper-binding protein [Phenylobacterium]MBB3893299.1 Cu/Ag efflux protein CusF [Phenylobacterium haematophilum]MBP6878349.1 copper-binding protein [Phenylobacterium sp.]